MECGPDLMKRIFAFLKQWTLLIAIVIGAIGHSFFARFAPLAPWLLMGMLLLTFSNMSPRDLRFHPLHLVLPLIQLAGSVIFYLLLAPWNPLIAQCACLCLLTPTATAAATITGMLGGSVAFIAAYIFIGNFAIVFAAPLIIPLIAPGHVSIPFLSSAFSVFSHVAPIMLTPLFLAWAMQRFTPKFNARVIRLSFLSYYLWAAMLLTLIGSTVDMLVHSERMDYGLEIAVAITGVIICLLQFAVGKRLGSLYHRRISTGQSLAQKNIFLSMWLTFQYLDPMVAVCLAAYSVFQNIFKSAQIALKARSDERVRRWLHAYHEYKHADMKDEARTALFAALPSRVVKELTMHIQSSSWQQRPDERAYAGDEGRKPPLERD